MGNNLKFIKKKPVNLPIISILILSFVVVGLVLVLWFIRVPETMNIEITFKTSVNDSLIFSKKERKIDKIFITRNEFVKNGQVLVEFESAAELKHVLLIKSKVISLMNSVSKQEIDFPVDGLALGSLQNKYLIFIEKFLKIIKNNKFSNNEKLFNHCINFYNVIIDWEKENLLIANKSGRCIFLKDIKVGEIIRDTESLFLITNGKDNITEGYAKLDDIIIIGVDIGKNVKVQLDADADIHNAQVNCVIESVDTISIKNKRVLVLEPKMNQEDETSICCNSLLGRKGELTVKKSDERLILKVFEQFLRNYNNEEINDTLN